MRDVLPEIERRITADFPDRLREWRANVELGKAAEEKWRGEVREAHQHGTPPPLPPPMTAGPEPQSPRLRQHDVTIEKVASLLATSEPKGLLICRDELAGWIDGMAAYNPGGRQFWVEAYGGRPYRVERVKHPEPIDIPRLAVAVYGTTQPDKLALLMRGADDGLLASCGPGRSRSRSAWGTHCGSLSTSRCCGGVPTTAWRPRPCSFRCEHLLRQRTWSEITGCRWRSASMATLPPPAVTRRRSPDGSSGSVPTRCTFATFSARFG